MSVGILTSWPLTTTAGSGVVASIRGFALGMHALGQDVQFVAPVSPSRTMTGTFLKRLFWNGTLPRRVRRAMKAGRLDSLVGFDFDGCYLSSYERPPLTVFCGGTLKDILHFERGWSSQLLKTQARMEAQNVQQADRVAVPSEYARRAVERHYGLAPGDVSVVPLAVEAAEWDALEAVPPEPEPERPVVLCVARFYRRKGLDLLLDAWREVRRGIGSGTLVILGDGPLHRELERRARESGPAGTVLMPGVVTDRARLKGWYRSADLFCLPSRHETFGLVYLEAGLHGLPSVALHTTAVPEVVSSGETGLLVQPDPDTSLVPRLTEAIRHLLDHDTLRLTLGAAARESAHSRTWREAAAELLPLLSI